ncbi:MAG: hypothetical protein OER86_08415 [Phycisphaerae bacterium]|nr:hypothetical protein [Phycisphaerae bacterium]
MTDAAADPGRALIVARTIWVAMAAGVLMIAVALGFIGSGRSTSGPLSPETGQLLFYVSLGMAIAMIPIAVVIRGHVFKRHWVGDAVEPRGYLAGNVMAWAICEGICLLGLVGCFVGGRWWPNLLPGVVGWLALVALWPNGRAMFARTMDDPRDPAARARFDMEDAGRE